METCKPASIPVELGLKMTKANCPQIDEDLADMKNLPYKSLLGFLMHASVGTQPHISYSTNFVAQYLSNPRTKHWSATKCILRNLKGTKTMGLTYKGIHKNFMLQGYSDNDWASNVDTCRSTSSYLFLLGTCIVSWSVPLSSTENEYMAISRASTNAI
jgi:hypothetical protein